VADKDFTVGVTIGLIDDLSKGIKGSVAHLKKAGTQIRGIGVGMTAAITAPFLLFSHQAINIASDLEESQNKVNVVFGESASIVTDFAKTAASALGLSRDQALEAAGTYGGLFRTMKMGSEESANMSVELVALASDLASFNNMDPTMVLDKLRAGLVGEAEPLKQMSILINETTMKTKAAELGFGALGAQLTESQKVQARYALILEQSTLQQGDFARTSDGLANSQRILAAEYRDAAGALGQSLLPMKLQLVRLLVQVLNGVNALPGPMKTGIMYFGLFAAAIGPVLMIGGQLMIWLSALKGMGGLAGVKVALASASQAVVLFGTKLTLLQGLVIPGGTLLLGLAAATALIWGMFESGRRCTESIKQLNKQLGITAGTTNRLGQEVGIAGQASQVAQLSTRIDELYHTRKRIAEAIQQAKYFGFKTQQYWAMGAEEGLKRYQQAYKEMGIEREKLIGERRGVVRGAPSAMRPGVQPGSPLAQATAGITTINNYNIAGTLVSEREVDRRIDGRIMQTARSAGM